MSRGGENEGSIDYTAPRAAHYTVWYLAGLRLFMYVSEVVQMSFELCSGLSLWHYMRCVHMAGRQSFRAAATALLVNPLQEDFLVLQLCLPLQHCWGGVKPSIGHAVTPMVVLVRLLAHAAAVYCALTGIAGCGCGGKCTYELGAIRTSMQLTTFS
jgi:hypothetical protein